MSIIDYHRPKTKERILRGERVHWVHSHKRSSYIERCILSYPPWVRRKELLELLERRKRTEAMLGVKCSMDHIIPLNHPRVCGLSVPLNFRITTKFTNDSKGNAWCEWHGELFDQPEQLRLF